MASGSLALITYEHKGFAAAVWPPTGISIACILVYGRYMAWTSVFANLFVFLSKAEQFGLNPFQPNVFIAIAALTLISGFQVLLGAKLVKVVVGFPCDLITSRKIFLFLFICGPAHAFFTSFLSVAVIYWNGYLLPQEFLPTAMDWWWNESVGGVLFVPITLSFIGEPRGIWRPRRISLAIPLFLFTITVIAFLYAAQKYDETIVKRQLSSDTAIAAEEFRHELGRLEKSITHLRDRYRIAEMALNPTERDSIIQLSDTLLANYDYVKVFGYAHFVPQNKLVKHRELSNLVSSNYQKWGVWQREPDGGKAHVTPRPWHAPIAFVRPDDGDSKSAFDLMSQAQVATVLDSIRLSGQTQMAWVEPQWDPTNTMPAYLLFISDQRSPRTKSAGGNEGVNGVFYLNVDTDKLIQKLSNTKQLQGLQFHYKGDIDTNSLYETQVFDIANCPITFTGIATPDYITRHRSFFSRTVLSAGATFAVLFTSLLLLITGRTASVAEEVDNRTAELHEEVEFRRKFEQELRTSRLRLAEAQRIALIGAWEWDADLDVVFWSDELSRLIGTPQSPDPSLEQLLALIVPEDRDTFCRVVQRAKNHSESGDAEFRVNLNGEQKRWMFARVEVADEKIPLTVIRGTWQDITEQKRMNDKLRETQKLESLGVLAGGIAHDFNNLLTGILGNAALVREMIPAESEAHEHLRVIEQSSEQAASLCQQMLAYAGRGPGIREHIELTRLVTESADLLRLSVHKRHDLQFELAPHMPTVLADSGQLRQVIVNFITNASEAIGPQSGTIIIRTGMGLPSHPKAESYAWLEVVDNGPGMPDDVKARVFEPFFTTKFTGRGLGLSAVHGIIRSLEGELVLNSTLGKGTSFKVYLPVVKQDYEELIRTPGPKSSLTKAISKPKSRMVSAVPIEAVALVADDETSVRQIVSTTLRAMGMTVFDLPDATTALEQLSQTTQPIHVVVLDVTMPGMEGVATLQRIAAIQPNTAVILMSGYSEHELSELTTVPCVMGFLHKPFRPSDLTTMVRRVIARSERAIPKA